MTDAVLITGAGSGIGLSSALRLAEAGFQVFATVPDADQRSAVEAAAAERSLSLRVLRLDVTDSRSIRSAVEEIVHESGSIFGVVHSAGLGLRGFFEDLSEEEVRRLFDVNVFGVMAVTREVLPHMRAAGRGRIAIIGSAGGRIATMTISAYCGSKFALEGFAESLALEVRPLGLEVSLIEPGAVLTPHFTVRRGRSRAALDPRGPNFAWFAQHERLVDDILKKSYVTAADVAEEVHRALTDARPRLRYVVGWRAKALIALRHYLPGELFERLYSALVIRAVTRPSRTAGELSGPEDLDVVEPGRAPRRDPAPPPGPV